MERGRDLFFGGAGREHGLSQVVNDEWSPNPYFLLR
jgi:hypothetical protein